MPPTVLSVGGICWSTVKPTDFTVELSLYSRSQTAF